MTEPMLTIQDVCDRLNVHEATVRRWLKRRQLKGTRLGGRIWRVSEAEVNRFIAAGQIPDSDNVDARR